MKVIKYLHKNMYLELLCFAFFVLAFTLDTPANMFKGYLNILSSKSILLTDYVYVGGIAATFFNVGLNTLFNLILLKKMKTDITGPIFAGMFMIIGFSFFGKNLWNGLPIYLGVWLYSLYKHKPMKIYSLSLLFAGGLSPIVSYCIFGFSIPLYIGIPLGIISGLIVGFIIPSVGAHTVQFHQGYNIYNTGFALGIISTAFYGIYTLCGLEVKTEKAYDNTNNWVFYIILGALCLFYIIVAFIFNHNVLKQYIKIFKHSGRLVSDYIKEGSKEAVMLNFSSIALVILLLLAIFKIPLNGIIVGSILATLGCSAFGIHLRNILPVWVGCSLAILVRCIVRGDYSISVENNLSIIMAFIFSTGLAPISGKFGILYGVFGGFLHISMIPIMINLQGGFDLYNNGLSCGFEAALIAIVGENIHKEKRHAKKSKDM